MKIATWNVNSINVRMPQLLGWLKSADVDVVCFQETKTIDENFPAAVLKELGYDAVFMGQKSYNGVAIISKLPIEDVQKNFLDDNDESPKRLIAATIKGVRVVNTYIPNGTAIGKGATDRGCGGRRCRCWWPMAWTRRRGSAGFWTGSRACRKTKRVGGGCSNASGRAACARTRDWSCSSMMGARASKRRSGW